MSATTATAPAHWLPRPTTLVCTLANPSALSANDRISLDIGFKPGLGRNGINGIWTGFANPAVVSNTTTSTLEVPAELLSRGEVRGYSVQF